MVYTPLTQRAMRISYDAHINQFDKCGVPYVFHPLHVAESMTDEVSCCAALLHDVVEDTSVTLADLSAAGMPVAVTVAVALLTRAEDADYLDYVRAIGQNPVARAVKLSDLEHNMDLSRLERISVHDIERNRLYAQARAILTGETSGN